MQPFSQWMREWLYGPQGYYATYKEIGKSGDFYTAVSASRLFGGSIANYIVGLIRKGELAKDATILEIGAHRGYLLADIVQFIYTLQPSLLRTLRFAILEPMPHLRTIQQDYFQKSFEDKVELHHYEDFAQIKEREGFVVANEIFDAFACDIFFKGKMAYVENYKIIFQKPDPFVERIANRYGFEKGEVARGYENFAQNLFTAFAKCRFVTFDYGDLEPRNDISLRIYTKHRVYPLFDEKLDLQEAFQRSDITYDVNFSHLIDAFEEAGFKKRRYMTQLAALVDFGITELLEMVRQRAGFAAYKREADKAKVLLHPSLMGERFKMVEFLKE